MMLARIPLLRRAWQEHWFLLAVVFVLPWQGVWIVRQAIVGGVVSPYATVGLYATDVLMVIALLLSPPSFGTRQGHVWQLPWWLVLAAMLSAVFVAGNTFVALWFVGTLLLFVLFGLSVWQHVLFSRLRAVVLASVGIQSLLAITQFFSQSIPASTILGMSAQSPVTLGASVVETTDGRWLRGYGSFPHPNILATHLGIGIVLVVSWYIETYEVFWRWWNDGGKDKRQTLWQESQVRSSARTISVIIATLALFTTALVLTFSRGSAVALLGALFIFYVWQRRRNPLLAAVLFVKVGVIVAAVVTTLVVLYPSLFTARLTATGRLEERSLAERATLSAQALATIQSHPLVGIGVGMVAPKAVIAQSSYPVQPPHNVALLFVMQVGAVGVLLLGMVLSRWRGAVVRLAQSPFSVSLCVFLLGVALFDHALWSLHSGLASSVLIIVLALLPLRSEEPEKHS